MRPFRTVFVDFACARCGTGYGVEVRFETGDDAAMPVYTDGDAVADLPSGARYDVEVERYCGACLDRWRLERQRAGFDALADQTRETVVRVVRLRWTSEGSHGISGTPDLAQQVPFDEIVALGRSRRGRGFATVGALLAEHELAVVPDTPETWADHRDRASRLLAACGWPEPADEPLVRVAVTLDDTHHIHVVG